MNLDDHLFLDEQDDQIKIKSTLRSCPFELAIKLLPKGVVLTDGRRIKTLAVDMNSVVMISIDQGASWDGKWNPNTTGEVYIKSAENLQKLYTIRYEEPINDLRKTKTYVCLERIAAKIAEKYNISWEFHYTIDAPAKEKNQTAIITIMIAGWFLIMTAFFLIWKSKYSH